VTTDIEWFSTLRGRIGYAAGPALLYVTGGWAFADLSQSLNAPGASLSSSDWETGYARSMGVFLNGGAIGDPDPRGQAVVDDSFLLLFNAADSAIEFTLPSSEYGERWEIAVDTSSPLAIDRPSLKAEGTVGVEARSVLVLRRAI